jgi:hypothetical protein
MPRICSVRRENQRGGEQHPPPLSIPRAFRSQSTVWITLPVLYPCNSPSVSSELYNPRFRSRIQQHTTLHRLLASLLFKSSFSHLNPVCDHGVSVASVCYPAQAPGCCSSPQHRHFCCRCALLSICADTNMFIPATESVDEVTTHVHKVLPLNCYRELRW